MKRQFGKSVPGTFNDKLEQADAIVILFCHEWHFCGALRVKEDKILRYDKFLIELAPFAID